MHLRYTCSFLFIYLTIIQIASAQQNGELSAVNGDFRGVSIIEVLANIQKKNQVTFYFDPAQIPAFEVNLQFRETPFFEALADLLSGTGLAYARLAPGEIVLALRESLNKTYALQLRERWLSGELAWPAQSVQKEITLNYGKAGAGKNTQHTFSGLLFDAQSKEPIAGATLLVRGTGQGMASAADGRFALALAPGNYILDVQFIGYESLVIALGLFANGDCRLEMSPAAINLTEVTIRAKADESNVRSTQAGVENLTVKTIRQLPSLLGETDIIKSLETLAGVSSVGEGSAGVNVRGGNIDQNLVIQDGAPIFNSAHALGFFSAFNADVVESVSLYKGSIPAQFGGRVSSVVDVQLRNGDFQRWHCSGGVGLAYGRLAVEGPILRDRLSVIVGGRLSYSDWMLSLVREPAVRRSAVAFHDLTVKISQRINKKHFLSLSAFQSGDFFRYADDFGYAWKSRNASAGWNYLLSDRLSVSLKAIAGDYTGELFEPQGDDAFRLRNGLSYYTAKSSLFYQPSSIIQYNVGAEWTRYQIKPEELQPYNNNSAIEPRTLQKDRGEEWAIYAGTEINLSTRWALSAGLRYSMYRQLGPGVVYTYDPLLPKLPENTLDTLIYAPGQLIRHYGGPEPRFSVKYQLSADQSLKFSYNRLRQYIHLLSNTAAATPVDLWYLSTQHISPQAAHTFSVGYFQNVKQTLWQLSFEVYYKKLDGLVTYKELPQLLLNEQIETSLLQAEGRAYGFETSVRKTSGKWSGQLSYTFSRSLLRTEGPFPVENINEARWFPANFDQPHQLSLVLRRQLSPIHAFTLNFTFRSGRPFTVPSANYSVGGVVVTHYSPRNESRIPTYHRLDLSFSSDKTQLKEKGYRSSWSLSFYNVYARRNAFSVYYKRSANNQQKAYKLSLIGSILPAFTYNFVF